VRAKTEAMAETRATPAGDATAGIGTRPGPLRLRCLGCGSGDLDVSAEPRGDEPVRCGRCGRWDSFHALETAAIEAVRRDIARRGGG